MRLYYLTLRDQREANWLIHRAKLGRLGYEVRENYADLVCSKCGKFSHDEVFIRGFSAVGPLRFRGDIARSYDGFVCVNSRFVELAHCMKFSGIQLKPITGSEWFVLNVTERVGVSPGVYTVVGGVCDACNRPKEIIGSVGQEGDLVTKPQSEGIFSTTRAWECSRLDDRPLLITEQLLACLKSGGIRGGEANLIFTEKEYVQMRGEFNATGKCKQPKDSTIVL